MRALPVLLAAVILAWPFPFVEPIRPPNELTRLFQARAIVEDGTLSIDGMMARHGKLFDLSVHEGRHYPNKAPGTSLLGAGVLWVFAAIAGVELGSVPLSTSLFVLTKTLLALPTFFLFLALRRYLTFRYADNRWAVDTACFAWLCGTATLPYSQLFYGHQLAAVLLAGGFLAYRRAVSGQWGEGWIAVGGLLSGAALLVEYTVAPAILVTGTYAALAGTRRTPKEWVKRSLGRVGLGLLGAALPLGALLWYHDAAFGHPLHTGYEHHAHPNLAQIHDDGAMGLTAPSPMRLVWSLFSGQGLLYLSPFLVLGFAGLVPALRRTGRRAEALVVVGVAVVYLAFTAMWDTKVWGWVLGPRHLVPLLPFLVGPAAAALSWLRDRPGQGGPAFAGAGAGLVLASVVPFVAGTVAYPHLPPELTNGVYQLAFPLLFDGYAVHSVGGYLAGRASLLAHAPMLLSVAAWGVLAALLVPGRATGRGRLTALGVAAVVCALYVGASAWRGAPGSTFEKTPSFVVEHYDPVPGAEVRLGLE